MKQGQEQYLAANGQRWSSPIGRKLFKYRPRVGFEINFNALVESHTRDDLTSGGTSSGALSHTFSWEHQCGRPRCSLIILWSRFPSPSANTNSLA